MQKRVLNGSPSECAPNPAAYRADGPLLAAVAGAPGHRTLILNPQGYGGSTLASSAATSSCKPSPPNSADCWPPSCGHRPYDPPIGDAAQSMSVRANRISDKDRSEAGLIENGVGVATGDAVVVVVVIIIVGCLTYSREWIRWLLAENPLRVLCRVRLRSVDRL